MLKSASAPRTRRKGSEALSVIALQIPHILVNHRWRICSRKRKPAGRANCVSGKVGKAAWWVLWHGERNVKPYRTTTWDIGKVTMNSPKQGLFFMPLMALLTVPRTCEINLYITQWCFTINNFSVPWKGHQANHRSIKLKPINTDKSATLLAHCAMAGNDNTGSYWGNRKVTVERLFRKPTLPPCALLLIPSLKKNNCFIRLKGERWKVCLHTIPNEY